MHRALQLVVLSLVLLLAGACTKPREGSPTDGLLSGPQYTNRYFGLSVGIPSGWTVGELQPHFVAPRNAPAEAQQHATPAAQNTYQLLMLSEKPLGAEPTNNCSLLVMAEEGAKVPGVKSARDYLARASQLMMDAPVAYHPVAAMAETRVGNAPAWRMDFTAQLGPNRTVRQTYLVCWRYGYALSFILSGAAPVQIQRLEQVLQSVRFE